MFFFLFKHKTAYEMRISDWSSDVCSSDLNLVVVAHAHQNDIGRRGQRGHLDTFSTQIANLFRRSGVAFADQRAIARPDQMPDYRHAHASREIGSASCRERACTYV